jgi:hypothetical protein
MKFEKLKDFITNEMKLGDNDRKYQPIVIRFLVQNGGSATRKEIENEIDAVNWHYKPLPTTKNPFTILTDDFPVCEYDEPTETYNLGKDFADYSINDKAWTIVECALKDETRKHALEEIVEKSRKVVSQLTNERDEVLGRYGPGGKDDLTSEKITKEKFIEFWRKENNYHWKAVNQAAGHVVKDIDMLRKNLKILFNENESVSERIKKLRGKKKGDYSFLWFGQAVYTPLLLVTSNLRHAVVNGPVEDALDYLRLWPKQFQVQNNNPEDEWKIIPQMQAIVSEVADRNKLDLWQIDWAWYELQGKDAQSSSKNYWVIIPGGSAGLRKVADNMIAEKTVTVGFHDADMHEYFGDPNKIWLNKKESFTTVEKYNELLDQIGKEEKEKYENEIKNLKKKQKLTAKEKKELKRMEKGGWLNVSKRSDQLSVFCKNHNQTISWRWMPLRDFMRVKEGDVVILWNGQNKVYAIGECTGNYKYVKILPDGYLFGNHHHQRPIKWIDTQEQSIPDGKLPGGQRATIMKANPRFAGLLKMLKLDTGGEKTYEGDTDNLDPLEEEEEVELKSTDPLSWPYHHMGVEMATLDNILKFGVRFVEDLDGQVVDDEGKKKFMKILQDMGISTTEKALQEPLEKYGKYVTLMYVFGIGRTIQVDPNDKKKGNKFSASLACKYYLHNKKDPKGFILNHLLRWQYPNGTNKQQPNETDRKLLPFAFTLNVLIQLSDTEIENAYLSKSEILDVVMQAKTMDEDQSVVEKILANRKEDKNYDLKRYTKEHWSAASRLFGSFATTGLIKYNKNNSDRSLEITSASIDEAKNTLLVHKPKYHEWQLPSRTKNDNKEVWDIHHGII